MAEPFEEFQFKPLTEGLGFHKKADKLKADMKSTLASSSPATNSAANLTPNLSAATRSPIFPETAPLSATPASESPRLASQSISDLMASLPPSLDFLDDKQDLTRSVPATPLAPTPVISPAAASPRPQIFQPLAREEYRSPIATGPAVGSVLPAPGTKAGGTFSSPSPSMSMAAGTIAAPSYGARLNETFAKKKTTTANATSAGEDLVPVAANFSAGLIDAMVIAGVSTILLVCTISITHVNLVAMLTNAKTDGSTQMNLAFLFFAVLQMYMLISRAFFGATLGEWAFDLQLGTDREHASLAYPIQVLWRTLVITLTGVVTIPLLSFAVGRDLARYLSGLQLYRRV